MTEEELLSKARQELLSLTPGEDLYVYDTSEGERIVVLKDIHYRLDAVKLSHMSLPRYKVLREFIFNGNYSKQTT